MPSYTFVIKKENMVFEFTTTNKDFIDKEFEKWINSISETQKESSQEEKTVKSDDKEVKVQPQTILPKESDEGVSEVVENKIEEFLAKDEPEESSKEGDLVISETPSAFQKLSRKLSEDSYNEPLEQEDTKEKAVISEEQSEEDDIELEFDTPLIDSDDDFIEFEEVEIEESEFDAIFQEKINSKLDEYKPAENKKFIEYAKDKKIEKPVDGLVLAAKYLLDIENKDRFIMKDIMGVSAENSIINIDYALISKAVSLGFVKVVPDLTGIADVVEYALTPKGEDYFNV